MSDVEVLKLKSNFRYYEEYEVRVADFHVGNIRVPIDGFSGNGTVFYDSPMKEIFEEKVIRTIDEGIDFITDHIFKEYNESGMRKEIITAIDPDIEPKDTELEGSIQCPHCDKYFDLHDEDIEVETQDNVKEEDVKVENIEEQNNIEDEDEFKLLTINELADMLQIKPATIRSLRSKGGDLPPYIRIGKTTVRYSLKDVKEWMSRNYYESTSRKVSEK